MPKFGDKLYEIVDGEIQTYTFIEESVNVQAGATAPTWLVKSAGRLIRCSINHYYRSIKEAKEQEIIHLQHEIRKVVKQRLDLELYENDMIHQISKIKEIQC